MPPHAALPPDGEQAVELPESVTLATELGAERTERLRHAVGGFVNAGSQRSLLTRDVLQLGQEERLANTGVAMNVKEKTMALILRCHGEVLRERGAFRLPAEEAAAPTFAENVLY